MTVRKTRDQLFCYHAWKLNFKSSKSFIQLRNVSNLSAPFLERTQRYILGQNPIKRVLGKIKARVGECQNMGNWIHWQCFQITPRTWLRFKWDNEQNMDCHFSKIETSKVEIETGWSVSTFIIPKILVCSEWK